MTTLELKVVELQWYLSRFWKLEMSLVDVKT